MIPLVVRQASVHDTTLVNGILTEASRWLNKRGIPMWQAEDLSSRQVAADVSAGLFFVGEYQGQTACIVKFQLEDYEFWPDIEQERSAFIHRLAIRRRFAGGQVSSALLRWSAQRTLSLGRSFLRLDCDALRPRLRAIYERFGFVHHSDRQVGSFFVSRYEYDVTKKQHNPSGHPPLAQGQRG